MTALALQATKSTLPRTVRSKVHKTIERPLNSLDWAKRIDSREIGPQEILRDCKFSLPVVDFLLIRAYREANGGIPCGA